MTTFAQAQSDLDALVGVAVSQGENAWQNGDYTGAVTAYQQAGAAGAQTLGPEIDSCGQAQITQNFTQQAWQLNAVLAAIPAATATQTQALEAASLAQKMLQLYQQAIDAGQTAAGSSSALPVVLALGGFGLLAGIVVGVLEVRHKRRRKAA